METVAYRMAYCLSIVPRTRLRLRLRLHIGQILPTLEPIPLLFIIDIVLSLLPSIVAVANTHQAAHADGQEVGLYADAQAQEIEVVVGRPAPEIHGGLGIFSDDFAVETGEETVSGVNKGHKVA